eukprot:9478505-Pyramimonas_sp.AAC.1
MGSNLLNGALTARWDGQQPAFPLKRQLVRTAPATERRGCRAAALARGRGPAAAALEAAAASGALLGALSRQTAMAISR